VSNITVILQEPLASSFMKTTYCRLQDSVPSKSELFSKVVAAVVYNPTTIHCLFPAIEWLTESNLCLLSLSLNEAADFSIVYRAIRVVEPPRGLGSAIFLRSNHTRAGRVVLRHSDLGNNTSPAIGCLSLDEDKEPSWFLPATQLNSSHITCMDGAGILANGGSIALLDRVAGLVSRSPTHVEAQQEVEDLPV
jgi:hypothetical protein